MTQRTAERTRSSLLRGGVGAILVLIGFTAVPFVTFFGLSPTLSDIAGVVSAFGDSLRDTKGAENIPWLILIAAVVAIVATGVDIRRMLVHQAAPTKFVGWVVAVSGAVAAVVLVGIWAVLAEVLEADAGHVVRSPSSWIIAIGALLMLTAIGGSPSDDERQPQGRSTEAVAHLSSTAETDDDVLPNGGLAGDRESEDAATPATLTQRDLEVRAIVSVALSAVMVVLLIVGAFAEADVVVAILVLSPFVILAGRHSRVHRALSEQLPDSVRWTLSLEPGAASAIATAVNGIVWLVALGLWWTGLMWLAISALCVLGYMLADFDRLASRLSSDITIAAGDREYRFSTVFAARAAALTVAILAAIVFLAREDIWWIG